GSTQETLSRYETDKRRINQDVLQRIADELTQGIIPKLYILPEPGMTPADLRRAYDQTERDFQKRIRSATGRPLRKTKRSPPWRTQDPVDPEPQLEGELAALWEQMAPAQRRTLVEIAKAILAERRRRRASG